MTTLNGYYHQIKKPWILLVFSSMKTVNVSDVMSSILTVSTVLRMTMKPTPVTSVTDGI